MNETEGPMSDEDYCCEEDLRALRRVVEMKKDPKRLKMVKMLAAKEMMTLNAANKMADEEMDE